jgi:hypothetical protein
LVVFTVTTRFSGGSLSVADWVGIAALVVSTVTLAFVLADDLRRRRRFGPARSELNPLGWGTDEDGPFEVVEMANAGHGWARISWLSIVGCTLDQTMQNRIRWDLGPGEKVVLNARPTDPVEDPWFVVAYGTTEDVRWVHVTWSPIMSSGPLRDVWGSQMEAQSSWKNRWFPWFRADRTVVGPTGATSTRLRLGNEKKLLKVLVRTQEAMPKGRANYMAGSRGRDLGRPPTDRSTAAEQVPDISSLP